MPAVSASWAMRCMTWVPRPVPMGQAATPSTRQVSVSGVWVILATARPVGVSHQAMRQALV